MQRRNGSWLLTGVVLAVLAAVVVATVRRTWAMRKPIDETIEAEGDVEAPQPVAL